jgi:uncharacterized protein (TIGR03083 family)
VRELIETLLEAGQSVQGLMASPEVAAGWDRPSALAGMTTGALCGHVSGAIARAEDVLDGPEPTDASVVDLAAYYGVNRVDDRAQLEDGIHPFVRDDGAKRAEVGPAALAESFARLLDRLGSKLAEVRADRLVPVIQVRGGASRLEDYLRTRVVELVVHGDDLAVSAGVGWSPPAPAVDVALGVFTALARARSGDLAVLRAFARAERSEPEVLRVL